MSPMTLVAGASTQSRARRPLPPGAVSAMTLAAQGVHEIVEFRYADGHSETRRLLSWVGGQWGGLWGASPPRELTRHVRGIGGSYGHRAEYALAEALGAVYDGRLTTADMGCRFFQNGGDACAAAVRLARFATGREPIATQGYHGAGDCLAHAPHSNGVPRDYVALHRRFEFGDLDGLRQAASGAACVMVEAPAWWDNEGAIALFLSQCRAICDAEGIPLIVDDVVCGFRLALAGTLERYGVRADLVGLGKALCATGGVAALVGRADLMRLLESDVFYSTTFGGAPGPCATAAATVRFLREHAIEVYAHLYRIGQGLQDGFNAIGVPCIGQPVRSVFAFGSEARWLEFCSLMIEQGIMVHRPNFPSLAHADADVAQTLEAARRVMGQLDA